MGKDGVLLVAVTRELMNIECVGIKQPHSGLLPLGPWDGGRKLHVVVVDALHMTVWRVGRE